MLDTRLTLIAGRDEAVLPCRGWASPARVASRARGPGAGEICFADSELSGKWSGGPVRRCFHGAVNATTTETLTAADRCDRCGAQAYVRVVLATGELLFCAHHAREHAAALADVALDVQDETKRLLEQRGAGSTL